MRVLLLLAVALFAGCVDGDQEAHSQPPTYGFVATYEGDDCTLRVELGPGGDVVRSDLEKVPTWRISWDSESSEGHPCAVGLGPGASWVGPDLREVRRDHGPICYPDCGEEHVLDFMTEDGLAPFGVGWPRQGGQATTVIDRTPVDVTVVDDGDWLRLGGWPTEARWHVFGEDFRFRLDGEVVPAAMAWWDDEEDTVDRVLKRTSLERTEALPRLDPHPPFKDLDGPLLETAAPGSDLDVYHLGFTLDEAVAAARDADDTFDAVLEDGCLEYVMRRGAGASYWRPADAVLLSKGESIDLAMHARNATHAWAVVATYGSEEGLLVDITSYANDDMPRFENEPAYPDPAPCLPLHVTPWTIESVRDAVEDLPMGESMVPCTWSVRRPAPLPGAEARLYIKVRVDGFAHTGTYWGHFDEEAPDDIRWHTAATMDATAGRWAELVLRPDEITALDEGREAQRPRVQHDDGYISWCKYFETEDPLVPPAGAIDETATLRD